MNHLQAQWREAVAKEANLASHWSGASARAHMRVYRRGLQGRMLRSDNEVESYLQGKVRVNGRLTAYADPEAFEYEFAGAGGFVEFFPEGPMIVYPGELDEFSALHEAAHAVLGQSDDHHGEEWLSIYQSLLDQHLPEAGAVLRTATEQAADTGEPRTAAAPWAPSGQWYHGSWKAMPLGTILVPGGPGQTTTNFDHIGNPAEPVVWLTKDPAAARLFVDIYHSNSGRKSGDVYIYRVEPMGQVYPMDIGEWATAQARIVEIVEQPDHEPLVASKPSPTGDVRISVNVNDPGYTSVSAVVVHPRGDGNDMTTEVGYLTASATSNYGGITGVDPVMSIDFIKVDDGWRGLGIASKLFTKADALARERGLQLVHDHDGDRSSDANRWIRRLPPGQMAMPRSQYDDLVQLSVKTSKSRFA